MSRTKRAPQRRIDQFDQTTPRWPTAMRRRLRDGRLVGIPGAGVWLCKKVPLSPVKDAKTLREQLAASAPLMNAYEAVAGATRLRGAQRRSMAKANYRHVHTLMVDIPQLFSPPRHHPCAVALRDDYGDVPVEQRVLLFGVRLRDRLIGSGGLRGAVESVMETLTTGGTPIEDFDDDFAAMDGALSRAGLLDADASEIRLANAWFNYGLASDPMMRPEVDSLTVFSEAATARYARRHLEDVPLDQWPQDLAGYHSLSFAAVQDIELNYTPSDSPVAQWGTQLLDAGAAVVSIRGQVEPASITRKEVVAQQKRYIADINDRAGSNKLDKAEQHEMLAELEQINALYGSSKAPATLVDASVVAGFGQAVEDMEDLLGPDSPVVLTPMTNRQPAALAETWLCSNVRANPHLQDLPVSTVAYSGLVSLSTVGDQPRNGAALVGFTEEDNQPAWFDPRAAYQESMAPVYLAAGDSGSGKSMLMLHTADQLARAGTPCVLVDPKQGSDFSAAVEASGGQIVSLDELVSSDGVFDPLRFGISPDTAIDLAASMLQEVNPWGDDKAQYEAPANIAIAYGVEHGATCTGQALLIAKQADKAPPAMVDRVIALAESNPQFRAMCGINPTSDALRVAEGITYIRVGDANLSLPDPGATNLTLTQRISVSLVRLMVSGSAMAMTGRNGVVMLDEAWVFLGAGNAELERLSRVARSQNVTAMLFTQRVSDATLAGIDEHIAGGFILGLKRKEAKAACQILQLEPTEERLGRITAKKAIGGVGQGGLKPNWNSMRALHEPGTDTLVRGSVALYADIHGRVVPVEVTVAPSFLARTDTTVRQQEIRRKSEQPHAALAG